MTTPYLPVPLTAYELPVGTQLYRETWNAAFASMHARLVSAEVTLASVDTALDDVEAQALQLISVNLAGDIQAARNELDDLRAQVDDALADIAVLLASQLPASNITVSSIPNLSATNAQAALLELQGDITARPTLGLVIAFS